MALREPARTPRYLRAEPLATGGADGLPPELGPRRLLRRMLQVIALLAAIVLVALLAPGLGEVRGLLGEAAPGWLAVAVVLEALSCGSYVLLFRGIFCPRMSWRTSSQIAWSELAVGSLVPAAARRASPWGRGSYAGAAWPPTGSHAARWRSS
jgi:hypothetical protein